MTAILASPNDRHANCGRPNGVHNLLDAADTNRWLRAVLIGVALVLAMGQAFTAGTLVAKNDPSGSGTGVLDETIRSQSLIELSQGAGDDVAPPETADAFDSRAATEWVGADSALRALQSPQIDASIMCVTCFTVV